MKILMNYSIQGAMKGVQFSVFVLSHRWNCLQRFKNSLIFLINRNVAERQPLVPNFPVIYPAV